MRSRARAASLLVSLAAIALHAAAQEVPKGQGSAVITGHVTISGKPAQGVSVALYRLESPFARAASSRVMTDDEGNYRMTGLPAGRYTLLALAPAYVGQSEGMFGGTSKTVTVAEGETVEKIDFRLLRGGVVTGRVRQEDGTPAIGERVQLNPVGGQGDWRRYFDNPFMYETDDRGVYRLYGIAPGKYTVSVGEAGGEGEVRFGFGGRGYYQRTYHPDTTDAAKAIVIEIGEGTEVTNADITLGRRSRSYVATGRVVDEAGKPVAGVQVGHGALRSGGEGEEMGATGWGTLSDSEGRFRLDGLLPGRYAAFVWTEGNAAGYSDPVKFEVTDDNVTGLTVTFRRGATLSGVVVIEGTSDPAVLARLRQLSIGVYVQTRGPGVPSYGGVKLAPDGTFHMTGLRPGKAMMYLASYPPPPDLTLARVERDGVPQQEIEVAPGAHVTGLRVVLEYSSGRVRGTVTIVNGPIPEGVRLNVSARRRGDSDANVFSGHGVEIDARGRFVIENLPPGEYVVGVQPYYYATPQPRQLPIVTQTVTINNGVTAEVNLILDFNAKPAGGQP